MDKMESRGTYTEYLPSYTVGVDAYLAVPHVTRYFGTKAVVIGGETAMSKGRQRLLNAIVGSQLQITDWICFGGQSTHKRAHELAELPQVKDADMLFAMGGGRAIDTVKEVATIVDKPYFAFPTLASNCAPVTCIGVFYHDDGSADVYFIPQEPPVHCFIDTKIIVESVPRWSSPRETWTWCIARSWAAPSHPAPARSPCSTSPSRRWQTSAPTRPRTPSSA